MPPVAAFFIGLTGVAGSVAVGSIGAYMAGVSASSFLFSTIAGRLIVGIAFSELSKALSHHNTNSAPVGVSGSSTVGEDTPESFILGLYATAGWAVCPDMTHGVDGKTPNAYLTQVREVSGLPGCTLSRVMLGGSYVTLGADDGSGYGRPVEGDFAGYAWVKFYDGTQTAADPMLIDKYGAHPDRPWTAEMIGTGICYAILTLRYNKDKMSSVPSAVYEINGAALYDPRKDSTVGGSGSHIWGDASTYETTLNAEVMEYNVLRGIEIGADTWGGTCAAEDLPLSDWFAAMNACDATVENADLSTEAAWRAGLQITLDQKPMDIISALNQTCSGEIAEVGGVFKPRVGGPGLPVYYFTDEDVIVSSPDDFTPFPGLDQTYNAVSANYPDPESLWQSKAAPIRTSATFEAEDQNRRLPASLSLAACPFPNQVQRLQTALLNDNRRFRQHTLVLPPDAAILEPLDVASWTSSLNGYDGKSFELSEVADDQSTCLQSVTMRERDSADYVWTSDLQLPVTAAASTAIGFPTSQALADWTVAGITINDSLAIHRLPALQVGWADPGTDDVRAILIEVRRVSDAVVISSSEFSNVAALSAIMSQGIVSGVDYEARGKIVPYTNRATDWSSWLSATAPDVVVTATGAAPDFWTAIEDLATSSAEFYGVKSVGTLPATGDFDGQVVLLLPGIVLYRWSETDAAWGPVNAGLLAGYIVSSMIAAGQVTAAHISVSDLSAIALTISNLLTIDGTTGGFSFGKTSATDFETDGMFAGRPGTEGAFAFLLGRTSLAGNLQYLRHTSDEGLEALNMRFRMLVGAPSSPTLYTTSQTITPAGGTKAVSFLALGGGGGGASGGSAGTATTVEIYDGATLVQSWSPAGGAAGGSATAAGQSSALGTGGAAGYTGYHVSGGESEMTVYPPGDATGYGAGGGAAEGSHGGACGASVTVTNYDISALVSPSIVITIGSAGTGSLVGADGSPGAVQLTTIAAVLVPANVVPLKPTASGTFTKGASATGATIFPDLGPGMWELTENGSNASLGLTTVTISSGGHTISALNSRGVTFVSDIRPVVTASSASSLVIKYNFYAMKDVS